MALDFFKHQAVNECLQEYIKNLQSLVAENKFETKRNKILIDILQSFSNLPDEWDSKAEYSIENYKADFISLLQDNEMVNIYINRTFVICHVFAMEVDMFETYLNHHATSDIKDFCIENLDDFDPAAQKKIIYNMRDTPGRIVRRLVFAEDIKTYRDFIKKVDESKELYSGWDNELKKREVRVQKLNDTLLRHESEFNFVGLYDGFFRLGEIKRQEIDTAKKIMLSLGVCVLLPLIFELFYVFFTQGDIGDVKHLIKIIPVASITLILIYYFRIALNNYNSIKTQIAQIELRKSLCCFIESYAEYAKGIKSENNETLAKFEDIIFSNIMISEDKMPSTFDGIDQIANLIGALKNSKSK